MSVVQQCDVCGESHEMLYVHGRCHPDVPTWTVINLTHSTAEVRCSDCDKLIVTLHLA